MATLAALAGVLVTLVFNTIGVFSAKQAARDQADSAKRTSLDTQIATLTSISAYLQQVDAGVVSSGAIKACKRGRNLTAGERRRVVAALSSYEYLAWLFGQRTWRLQDADRYWHRKIVSLVDLALQEFDSKSILDDYPELKQYKNADGPSIKFWCRQPPLTG